MNETAEQVEMRERAAAQRIVWSVAQVKPNSARIARRNLGRQGFETFLPLERYTRRQGRNLVKATRPYFSGYVFVGSRTGSAPWRAIRSTPGIARLVCFGATSAIVPAGLVESLQDRCDPKNCIEAIESLACGDGVIVAQGAFATLLGRIERLSPQERAWVLIDVLGQAIRVSVPRACLRPAGAG